MPYNFVADSFYTQKNFVADFLQVKCNFRRKTAVLRFWAALPFGGSGATYNVRVRLIRKLVMDFLLVLVDFLLGVMAEALQANIDWNRCFRSNEVSLAQNFR